MPTPHPGADDAPSPELLAAVDRAARHVGPGRAAGEGSPVRFDALRTARARTWALAALLAASGALAVLADRLLPSAQSAAEVEADLRWAVAHVVRGVEAHRSRTGALPGPEALGPLLGEHLRYQAAEGAYVVTGERDGVRVLWDGSTTLERWMAEGAPGR